MRRPTFFPVFLSALLAVGAALPAPAFAWWSPPQRGQEICPRGLSEHRIDWMAFVDSDADPAGVPRRVLGRQGNMVEGDTIGLRYGGLTRRLGFDSPRAQPAGNLRDGFFRVDYDLLQFEEFVEIELALPRAMDRFTLVLGGLGSSLRADVGVDDAVWIEGITPDGQRVSPGYFYPALAAEDSTRRVTDRAQRDGFGAPWMTGEVHTQRLTRAVEEPIGAAFRTPVVSVVLRFSGLPARIDGMGGWADGAVTNPPEQSVDIISGAYCG